MIGRRLPDTPLGKIPKCRAGDYWKIVNEDGTPLTANEPTNLTGGVWRVAVPMSYGYAIGNLMKHTVREHEDGTISVREGDGSSNSILVIGHRGEQWHGYIEHGRWQSV